MSRPKKATVDYFPHYVNHGKTMFTLEAKFGNDGYAFWFKVLELLGNTENHYIDCCEPETWEFLLAKTRLREDVVTNILDLLAKIRAIDAELWQNKVIWSENYIDNLASVYSRRDVSLMNKSDLLELLNTKTPISGHNDDINPQSKVKESIVNETKVNEGDAVEFKLKFDLFRKDYPGPKRGLDTEFINFKKHRDWRQVLPLLEGKLKNQKENRAARQLQKKFVPEWKNLQTWINQRCWEEEISLDTQKPKKISEDEFARHGIEIH